jgi:hypothetical protein
VRPAPFRKRVAASAAAAALAVGLTVGGVWAPREARADDAAEREGRALFDEGVALGKQGRWAEACPKLAASLERFPGIGTRGKLAECHEKLGHWASAWKLWKEVAELSARAGEATRERIATEHAKALEAKVAYVTVAIPPASEAPGLVVKRDGVALDASKIGAAEPVDPGSLAFEVSAPGKKTFSAEVSVAAGQSVTFHVPALEPASGVAAGAPGESNASGASGSASTAAAPAVDFPAPETDRVAWQKPVGLVVAGLGVAGVAVGSVVGLSAKSTYDSAFDGGGCDGATNRCDASGQSKVDDARSSATLSTILFAAGGALAIGGVVLYLTAPRADRAAVRVVPAPYASGAGVLVSGAL